MNADAEALALLREIRDLLRAAQERARPEPDAALIALPQAIARVIGSDAFTCADLKERAELPGSEALRAALVAVAGDPISTKRLGRKFRLIEGRAIDGLSVHRIAARNESHGVLWMAKEV